MALLLKQFFPLLPHFQRVYVVTNINYDIQVQKEFLIIHEMNNTIQ